MNDSRQLSSGPVLVYLLQHIVPVTFLLGGFPKHTYTSHTQYPFLLHPFPDSLDNPHSSISQHSPHVILEFTSPTHSTLNVDVRQLFCWCLIVCPHQPGICFHRLWGRGVEAGWAVRMDKQMWQNRSETGSNIVDLCRLLSCSYHQSIPLFRASPGKILQTRSQPLFVMPTVPAIQSKYRYLFPL